MPFAGHLGRHALPHFGLEMRVLKHGALRLAEEVDEAGRDDVVVRVDRRGRGLMREIADGDDRVAANADVAADTTARRCRR